MFSDGLLTPQELIDHALEAGLSGLSITDHDNIAAYHNMKELKGLDSLKLLPGVELSCRHKDRSIHVLCYAFKEDNAILEEFSLKHKERRRCRNIAIMQALAGLGIRLSAEEVMEFSGVENKDFWGRSHIARALVAKGVVKDIKSAFREYLGDGCPAFRSLYAFSVEETIDTIHRAGGKAVLAHPHIIKNRAIVNDLFKLKFDGVEGYYAHFSADQEQRWLDLANKHGLFITGGSDFHGSYIKHNRLGSSWASKETFDMLWNHYCNQK